MPSERTKLQIETLGKALATLHRALGMNETPEIRDSVIKRFEYTFEMAWKALHRTLTDRGESLPQMVSAVLPAAFVARMIGDADLWNQIRDYRNLTAHAYDEKVAIDVAAFVRAVAVAEFDRLFTDLSKVP